MVSEALCSLRRSAAYLLSFTISEMFPNITITDCGITNTGFYCDIQSNPPLHQEQIDLIHRQYTENAKANTPIRISSMVASNAKDMLHHNGYHDLADSLPDNKKLLIDLIHINDWITLYTDPILADSTELQHISLSLEKQCITGTIGKNKQDLKEQLKLQKKTQKNTYLKIAQELNLLTTTPENTPIYTEKGLKFQEILKNHLQSQAKKANYTPILTNSPNTLETLQNHHQFYLQTQINKLYEFNTKTQTTNHSTHANKEKILEACISSLQFVLKSFRILNLRHNAYLLPKDKQFLGPVKEWKDGEKLLRKALDSCQIPVEIHGLKKATIGPSIAINAVDQHGKEWTGTTIQLIPPSVHQKSNEWILNLENPGPIEPFLALLIEHYQGTLPLYLSPEHVHVLHTRCSPLARQVELTLKQQGMRVTMVPSKEPFKQASQKAEKEQIPYIVIIGEREEQSGKIRFRSRKERKSQSSEPQAFYQRLQEETQREMEQLDLEN